MTTRIIGIKEYRQNLSKLWKEARKKGIRFIVMHHAVPVLDVRPVEEDALTDALILEKYSDEIEKSLKQAERGEVYTLEEVADALGITL